MLAGSELLPAARRVELAEAVLAIYAGIGDLATFPGLVSGAMRHLMRADIAGYGEHDLRTGERRASIEPLVPDFVARRNAYGRHRDSHAFWQMAPEFFRGGPLRHQDVFGEDGFRQLPIYAEALQPAGVTAIMQTAWAVPGGHVGFGVFRLGGPSFDEVDRGVFAALQMHLQNARELSWYRTLSALEPQGRAELLFPQLSPRQREVLHWIGRGKDNVTIAELLGIRVETVKDHLKDIYAALGVESRLGAAVSLFDVANLHVPNRAALLPEAPNGKRPQRA